MNEIPTGADEQDRPVCQDTVKLQRNRPLQLVPLYQSCYAFTKSPFKTGGLG